MGLEGKILRSRRDTTGIEHEGSGRATGKLVHIDRSARPHPAEAEVPVLIA